LAPVVNRRGLSWPLLNGSPQAAGRGSPRWARAAYFLSSMWSGEPGV
jgi:hypothetical protein